MKGRILIADDEKLTRETLKLTLEEEGFHVWVVSNPEDAFPILEKEQVDVIVTDLRMPTMDGIQFQNKVGERWAEIDFIFITAFGSVATAVTAIREGAADYMTKPLDTEELVLRLERLVVERRDREKLRQLQADDPD